MFLKDILGNFVDLIRRTNIIGSAIKSYSVHRSNNRDIEIKQRN